MLEIPILHWLIGKNNVIILMHLLSVIEEVIYYIMDELLRLLELYIIYLIVKKYEGIVDKKRLGFVRLPSLFTT